MRSFYRGLSSEEKALVWIGAAALILLIVVSGENNLGVANVAQAAATLGTFLLAYLALAQVREMREARVAQDRPQVMVDADYRDYPVVNVVARNIGKGAAKNITFEFSDDLVTSFKPHGSSEAIPANEFSFFKKGLSFLPPGREVATFWGDFTDLSSLLDERGLKDGITITSKYSSLNGHSHETQSNINPLRTDPVLANKKDINDLVKAVDKIQKDLNKLVSDWPRELKVSTDTEPEDRKRREQEARARDEGRGGDDEEY